MESRKSMANAAPTVITGASGSVLASSSLSGEAGGAGAIGFFEKERERLIEEISTGFEELMTSSNVLNRKLEEVFGVGKEFETVAGLWGKFNNLIREQKIDPINEGDSQSAPPPSGIPGTGGKDFRASVAERERER